ncbi:Beta-barrel assembly-enhancing protease [Aquabacterium sp. CECT 9606]|nr:Beta-barrel assembly-enhancing protease [Aquabacterium sp. CECT 9606]
MLVMSTDTHSFPRARLLPWLLTATLLASCATVTNPVTGLSERTVMDEKSEIAEGEKGHQQVLKEYGVYDNPKVQAYVNALGQRLAQQSHRNTITWHFTVLDSPEINAFALPGGYVYVTRGIMAYMDSEAHLAGVIGHEIGHVTARHGAQRATRQQTAGFGVLAASLLGAVLESQGMGGAGQLASQLSQNVAAGYIASYSRDQETQADQLGAEYLARNHYNPQNMVDVIKVLKDQERFADDTARAEGRTPGAHGNWLSSHPSNDKRLQDITQIAANYPSSNYSDDGRSRYLDTIKGMTFGESREQGLTRGRNFYHEPLGIAVTAPEGWKIQNTSQSIALLNAAADAGLVIKSIPAEAGSTHEDIIRNVLKPEQGRTEPRTLSGGLPATHFVGARRNQQGQAQRLEATVVTGPANHHYLLGYAAKDAAALQRAAAPLREAENSFRALTAADRAAARPWAIKLVAYPKGGFQQLAKQSPGLAMAEQQLRLINGVYAEGEPKAGQTVKVID